MNSKACRHVGWCCVLLAAAAAAHGQGGEAAFRDPFWPLGFRPAQGAVPANAPPVAPPVRPVFQRPPQEAPRAVTPQEWVDAEKALGLVPAKFSMGVGADGAAFILLWGKIRSKGDLVNAAWNGVEFWWRVSEVGNARAEFERVRAEFP